MVKKKRKTKQEKNESTNDVFGFILKKKNRLILRKIKQIFERGYFFVIKNVIYPQQREKRWKKNQKKKSFFYVS